MTWYASLVNDLDLQDLPQEELEQAIKEAAEELGQNPHYMTEQALLELTAEFDRRAAR